MEKEGGEERGGKGGRERGEERREGEMRKGGGGREREREITPISISESTFCIP